MPTGFVSLAINASGDILVNVFAEALLIELPSEKFRGPIGTKMTRKWVVMMCSQELSLQGLIIRHKQPVLVAEHARSIHTPGDGFQ